LGTPNKIKAEYPLYNPKYPFVLTVYFTKFKNPFLLT